MLNVKLTDKQWKLVVERLQQIGDYNLAYNIDAQLTDSMLDKEHEGLRLTSNMPYVKGKGITREKLKAYYEEHDKNNTYNDWVVEDTTQPSITGSGNDKAEITGEILPPDRSIRYYKI